MEIAISSWSMNKVFALEGMTMPDFIRTVREDYGVGAVETVHWMLAKLSQEQKDVLKEAMSLMASGEKDPEKMRQAFMGFMKVMREVSTTKPDLEEVKAALKKYDVRVINMPIDYGNISEPDDVKRAGDIEVIKQWIDVAAELGALGARVNTGFQSDGFNFDITSNSYRELSAYANTKGVALVLENHGGMSADPDNIVKLFEMVGNPNFRICPDFGNFEDSIRYEALKKIFALRPLLVHAKTYTFDENGGHVPYDFGTCMEISKASGFNGCYSVEFEGAGDQRDGIAKTIALLKKYA